MMILPLDEIRELSIIDVYEMYVGGTLHKRGGYKWAQCNWHGSDSYPSLKLYVDQQKWWCYGCSKGGTAIDLVMSAMDCDFKTAALMIAKDFNLNQHIDYHSRIKKDELNKKKHIDELFQADFNTTYLNLCTLNRRLYSATKHIKICLRYPTIFNYINEINNILDNMSSINQSEQVGGWRRAKAVFPWI